MIDQRNRQRMKQALVDAFGPPRPDLERLALASIDRPPARRATTRVLALAAVALVLALAASVALATRMIRPNSQTEGTPQQNAVLLEDLRLRPLNLPALASDGSCPVTPQVTRNVFFKQGEVSSDTLFGTTGPIYGLGGPEVTGYHGYYYRVTWLSDPTYKGLALVRGRKLDGREQIVFAGPLASGDSVVTDTIPAGSASSPTKFYSELVIPAGRPSAGVWTQWAVTQGVPGPGCYGFQVDGPSFQSIVVVEVSPGG